MRQKLKNKALLMSSSSNLGQRNSKMVYKMIFNRLKIFATEKTVNAIDAHFQGILAGTNILFHLQMPYKMFLHNK